MGLTLAACSDDLENGPDGGGLSGEKGYVKVAINLPTTSGFSTRADDGLGNDDFADGTANEYKVNKVYLLLFQGASEELATYQGGYDLGMSWNDANAGTATDNVTSRSQKIHEVTAPKGTGQVYALAIVNPNSMIDISTQGTLKVSGSPVTNFSGMLTKITQTNASAFIGTSKDDFMMVNAPLASKPGNSVQDQKVTTLVPITVYDSKGEAEMDNNRPDDIYVERVVAKVSVATTNFNAPSGSETRYSITVKNDGPYKDDKVYMAGWYLNTTNKSTKIVRDVTGWNEWATYANPSVAGVPTENRFFGLTSPYRVYWAVDGNYDDDDNYASSLSSEFEYHSASEPDKLIQLGNADYCLENTFNTTHMKQDETTGVVFKMSYSFDLSKPNETFYMIEGEETTYGLGDSYTDESTNIEKQINKRLSSAGFTIAMKSDPDGGYYNTVADLKNLFTFTRTSSTEPALTDDAMAQTLLDLINGVRVYKDGTTYYYAARIKHFGDYYTPLENGKVDVGDVSEYDAKKHLGRYGVVRNNWYEIVISSISGPGMPERPTTPPSDPDDSEDVFINLRVNILSWAKRSQNVDL